MVFRVVDVSDLGGGGRVMSESVLSAYEEALTQRRCAKRDGYFLLEGGLPSFELDALVLQAYFMNFDVELVSLVAD